MGEDTEITYEAFETAPVTEIPYPRTSSCSGSVGPRSNKIILQSNGSGGFFSTGALGEI